MVPMSTTEQIKRDIVAAGGLANRADLARVWNVSHEAVRKTTKRDDFPIPAGYVGERPVWLLDECTALRDQR